MKKMSRQRHCGRSLLLIITSILFTTYIIVNGENTAAPRARAIIVTGPESTDSTYVTRLIAHVMGVGKGLRGGFAGNIG